VLRGPQGTLYGRNSISGAINVISRRPTEDWYAECGPPAANYNRTVLEGAISGPTFLDNVQFRLVGNWEKQTEGWIDNIVPGQPDEGNIIDQKILEGQLQFQFSDDFEGWMKLTTIQWDNGAGGPGARASWTPHPYSTFLFQNAAVGPNEGFGLNPGTNGVNPSPLGGVNPALSDPRKIASTIPYTVQLDDTYIFASEWIYDFDFAALKYIAGGTRYHYTLTGPTNPEAAPITRFDLPTAAGPVSVDPRYGFTYEEFLSWFSHELNLASNSDGDFQWLVGAYHFRENYRQPVSSGMLFEPRAVFTLDAATGFAPSTAPNPRGLVYDSRPSLRITSKALYGQIDWEFAPTWKTTLGLRYSEDEKRGGESIRLLSYIANTFSPNFNLDLTRVPTVVDQNPPNPRPEGVSGPSTYDPATGLLSRPYDASWSATTGTAGLQWEPDGDTMAYVRYSKGYKAGGFRLGITSSQALSRSRIRSPPTPMKRGSRRPSSTAVPDQHCGFLLRLPERADSVEHPPTAGSTQGASVLFNVPEAVSRGLEFENIFQPVEGLQFLFNYSYLDAFVTNAFAIDPADPSALNKDASPGIVTNIPDNFLPGGPAA
jgi:iron complex outermembrane receptor protein